jgi:hypothetical protein
MPILFLKTRCYLLKRSPNRNVPRPSDTQVEEHFYYWETYQFLPVEGDVALATRHTTEVHV